MIVLTDTQPVLADREAIAQLTGRSIHTIRLRCTPVRQHHTGTPLYDLDASVERLAQIPVRQRREVR